NTVELYVPALRERPEDIPVLVEYYAERFARKYGKGSLRISKAALEKLRAHSWPGNVRELVHSVERAVIMSESASLTPDEFLLQRDRGLPGLGDELQLDAIEKRAIEMAIAKHGGNVSKAAQELGLGRTTLYRK